MAGKPWEKYQPGSTPAAASGGTKPWEKYSAPAVESSEPSMMDKAGDFAMSMVGGKSVAENMPGGETLANVGSKIGSGIVAATTTKPGAGYFDRLGEHYKEAEEGMSQADKAREMIDEKSPMATGVKEVFGELPMMAQNRSPVVAAETQAAQAPGWLSKASKYSTGAIGGEDDPVKKAKLMEYFKKYGPAVVEQGVEMLPYPIRAPLRAGMRIRNAGRD